MLPNFMVVGAQKAGTTSLHHYLREHPDIYLPGSKETKFFVFSDRYEKGLDYYQSEYFSGWRGEKAVGEVDPDYMYFEVALERMLKDLPVTEMKFIFVLRDPVERAFSHYLMTYRRGKEDLSFEEAIKKEDIRIRQDQVSDMHYSYTTRGYYSKQIKRFLGHVDKSKVLYLLSEDLKDNREETLKKVFRFLGVDENFTSGNAETQFHSATVPKNMSLLKKIEGGDSWEKKIIRILLPKAAREKLRNFLLEWNQTNKGKPKLKAETRKMLTEKYLQEYSELSELTGLDLSNWRAIDG